jgi:hypothetical protein
MPRATPHAGIYPEERHLRYSGYISRHVLYPFCQGSCALAYVDVNWVKYGFHARTLEEQLAGPAYWFSAV